MPLPRSQADRDLAAELRPVLDRSEAYIRREGCRGYDPYDGLRSPLMRLPFPRKLRWGFQQVVRRIPFQVRPLLGIPKGLNPVTLGLVLQAHAYRAAAGAGTEAYAAETAELVAELRRLVSPGWSGACWGYDFDWEGRFATTPAYHPTVVATGFVTNALYESHRLCATPGAAELIVDSLPFLLEDLNRVGTGSAFCWSYSPTDRQAVLNATMKGARLCAQIASLADRPDLFGLAAETASCVAAEQREDGSWPYSVSDDRSWADNFHTCYILDAFDEYRRLSGDGSFDGVVARGLDYYRRNFFDPDGAPRYYDSRRDPIDATACAQSLLTLIRFGEAELCRAAAFFCLDNMVLPDGSYVYRIEGRRRNTLPYMRWSIAWMHLALSRLELELASD